LFTGLFPLPATFENALTPAPGHNLQADPQRFSTNDVSALLKKTK
jgi:hypothetical protein